MYLYEKISLHWLMLLTYPMQNEGLIIFHAIQHTEIFSGKNFNAIFKRKPLFVQNDAFNALM